ncbi:MAG: YlzJ-like family protein [Deltaproteobacteria bacterium]
MILYSIIPPEVVFKNEEEEYYAKPLKVKYKGEIIEVIPVKKDSSDYMISRVLSSSPKAFLEPGLQPGTRINVLQNLITGL